MNKKPDLPQSRPAATHWDEAQIENLHRLYALRSQLAGFAAREAALRVAEGGSSAPLRDCYHAMHAAAQADDYAAFLQADRGFHHAISDLAGVPALVEMWTLLDREMHDFVGWAHRVLFHDLQMIADGHAMQFEAISGGNPEIAERAAHLDLDSLWQMLTSQPAEPLGEPDAVERACAYILLNLHRSLRLQDVARDVVHLSSSHLAKLFRDRRGESFSAYVQTLRMRRAASLLRETTLPIQDIATRVGYVDVSRFTTHFKRFYGSVPSEYRNLK